MSIISLADYRSYTNTSSGTDDAYITNLIGIVQDQLENYCDRLFDKQDYSEWYKYSRYLVLRQYPVNNIKYVGEVDLVATFDQLDYNYEITPTALNITDNTLTTTTVMFGGAITTLTDIKTAVETALPAITLTINSGYANLSYKLLRIGTGRDMYGCRRNDCQTKIVEAENRTVEFVMDSGFIFFTTADLVCDTNVFIVYNAGYADSDMPKTLKMIACNIVRDISNANTSGATGLVKSESITNYSITYTDPEKINQEIYKYAPDLEQFVKKIV